MARPATRAPPSRAEPRLFASLLGGQSLSAPGDAGHLAFRCATVDGQPLIGSHVTVMLPGQSRTP